MWTWLEQRAFLRNAVDVLPQASNLTAAIKAELAELEPRPFNTTGFVDVLAGSDGTFGPFSLFAGNSSTDSLTAVPSTSMTMPLDSAAASIGFDATGAIVHLTSSASSRELGRGGNGRGSNGAPLPPAAAAAAAARKGSETAANAAAIQSWASTSNPVGRVWYQGTVDTTPGVPRTRRPYASASITMNALIAQGCLHLSLTLTFALNVDDAAQVWMQSTLQPTLPTSISWDSTVISTNLT